MKVTIVIENGGTKVSFEMDGLELESAYTSIAQMLGIDPVQAWSKLRSATSIPPKAKPTTAAVKKVLAPTMAGKKPGKPKMTPSAKKKSVKPGPSVPTKAGGSAKKEDGRAKRTRLYWELKKLGENPDQYATIEELQKALTSAQ